MTVIRKTPLHNPAFYKEHPKTCAPDDYWGQVKRTVNGKAVSEDQIQMIEHAIVSGLELQAGDRLLDLCCGNGALSDRIFAYCDGGVGVDFSPALIEVAKRVFERPPSRVYHLEDVETFVRTTAETRTYTKALCYGSFQYLPKEKAEGLLRQLGERFPAIERVFIGNLPDKAQIHEFYEAKAYQPGIEEDPASPIGIWRSKKEFIDLASDCGWQAEFSNMPPSFYAVTYRYDVILSRTKR